MSELPENGKARNEQKKENSILIAAIAIACVLAVIIAGLFIFPDTRSRLFEKAGYFYLERDNFEASNKAFLKAGAARYYNIRAWRGAISSAQLGELENASECFLSAHEAFMRLNYSQLCEDEVLLLTEVYLCAPELITDNEKLIEVLEGGLSLLDGTRELYAPLADAWHAKAKDSVATEADKITAFMKVVEYTDFSEEVTLEAAEFIYAFICKLGEDRKYEEAIEYVDKCSVVLAEVYDVSGLRDSLAGLADFEVESLALLEKAFYVMEGYYREWEKTGFQSELRDDDIYAGMFSYDFSEMFRIDGSKAANRLAYFSGLWDESYIFSPGGADENFTGIGCGVYPYGEVVSDDDEENSVSYYFYFGEYENGKRNGHGISFLSAVATSFYGFEGKWQDGAPNGKGIYYAAEKYDYTEQPEVLESVEGTFGNGLQNGHMTVRISYNNVPGYVFKGTYEAKAGIAPETSFDTEKYVVSSNTDRYAIAILLTTDPMNSYYAPLFQFNDELLSVVGF